MDVRDTRLAALRVLLAAHKGKRVSLSKAIGKSPPQISQWLSGYRTITEETARKIEAAVGQPPGWMDQPQSPESGAPFAPPRSRGHRAHPASQIEPMIAPITIAWESILLEPLPPLFRAVIADNSMGIEYPKGCTVTFSTTEGEPRPRDLVLVADADGQIYFREYQAGRAGRWQAVAWVSGYQPLDSQADGLRVLAISLGRWGRRG